MQFRIYSVQPTENSVQLTVNSVQLTVNSVQLTVSRLQLTAYMVQRAMYIMQCGELIHELFGYQTPRFSAGWLPPKDETSETTVQNLLCVFFTFLVLCCQKLAFF